MDNYLIKLNSCFDGVAANGYFPKHVDNSGMFVELNADNKVFTNHMAADSLIRKLMFKLKLEHGKTVANVILVEKYKQQPDSYSLVFVNTNDPGADFIWNTISQEKFNELKRIK